MKQHLIQILIQQLQEQATSHERMIRAEQEAAIHAPSRMESRYDSEKQEASYRANTLMARRAYIHNALEILQTLETTITPCTQIQNEAIVTIQDEDQKQRMYFILPTGEGEVIKNETGSIIHIISPQSPIFSHIENKKMGDTYSFNNKQYTIINIQ